MILLRCVFKSRLNSLEEKFDLELLSALGGMGVCLKKENIRRLEALVEVLCGLFADSIYWLVDLLRVACWLGGWVFVWVDWWLGGRLSVVGQRE